MTTTQPDEATLTAFQLTERKKRTCFVGNLPLDTTPKQLKALFTSTGCKVDKVWFRSIATSMDSKIPTIKAKVIVKDLGDQKDNKNAYVLCATSAEAIAAMGKLNQSKVGDKHIRVDLDYRDRERDTNDFETTVFVGNLPFIVNEEDVREHFASLFKESEDPISPGRLIRDPQTFIGKGIGYIQFKDKETMRTCIEELNDSYFQNRVIRLKKAVEPRRLMKKLKGREEVRERKKEEKLQMRAKAKEDDDELDKLRNFEANAYAGNEDDEEEPESKGPGISKKSKPISKVDKVDKA